MSSCHVSGVSFPHLFLVTAVALRFLIWCCFWAIFVSLSVEV